MTFSDLGGSVEELDDDDDASVDEVAASDVTTEGETELVSPCVLGEEKEMMSHSCVMCGKTFKHRDNLNVHVMQAHLSTKAKLRCCDKCQR